MNFGSFTGTGAGLPYAKTSIKRQLFFPTSTTWTIPVAGYYTIYAIGAGGSGGVTNGAGAASGGGAGGCVIKSSLIQAGTLLTITCGAGGAGGKTVGNNGSAGGATSVVGGPFSLWAGGGSGGVFSSTTAVQIGGLGGSASGGDRNFVGGAGGNASIGTASTGYAAAGGGGVNFFGTGTTRGGNATSVSTAITAGGGGGIGGQGGDAGTATSSGTGGHATANGTGSTGSPSVAATNPVAITQMPNLLGAYAALYDLTCFYGYGTAGAYQATSSNANPGGGTGGVADNTGGSLNVGIPPFLGGMGGFAQSNPGGSAVTLNSVYWGGGAGGGAWGNAGHTSSAGGNGCVIITWEQFQ